MKPRIDINVEMARPGPRALLSLLLQHEEPLRMRDARDQLDLSIAQFGLATRVLERHGLALRRAMAADPTQTGGKLQHTFIEATDIGREHGPAVLRKVAPMPMPEAAPEPSTTHVEA